METIGYVLLGVALSFAAYKAIFLIALREHDLKYVEWIYRNMAHIAIVMFFVGMLLVVFGCADREV